MLLTRVILLFIVMLLSAISFALTSQYKIHRLRALPSDNLNGDYLYLI